MDSPLEECVSHSEDTKSYAYMDIVVPRCRSFIIIRMCAYLFIFYFFIVLFYLLTYIPLSHASKWIVIVV